MRKKSNWQRQKPVLAGFFAIIGFILTSTGILFEILRVSKGFDNRLITSTGILFIGISLAYWVQYRLATKDPQTAMREENMRTDERLINIRMRAGNRGFWASMAIIYALLMWESLSSNNSLPLLSDDVRWYWLAIAVMIPFGAYIVSSWYDESHS